MEISERIKKKERIQGKKQERYRICRKNERKKGRWDEGMTVKRQERKKQGRKN